MGVSGVASIDRDIALTYPRARVLKDLLSDRVRILLLLWSADRWLAQVLDSHRAILLLLIVALKGEYAIDIFCLVLREADLIEVDHSCIPHLISNFIENLATTIGLLAWNTYHLAASCGIQRVILHVLLPRLT